MSDPDKPLGVEVETAGTDSVVTAAGELDPHTAGILADAIERARAGDDVQRVVLDLQQVSFIDSSGLRVLLSANERLAGLGIGFTLRSPGEAVRRLLEITDLLGRLDVE